MLFPFGVAGNAVYAAGIEKHSDTFTKDSYNSLVKKNRKEYVHKYFLDVLNPLFEDLKADATAMKSCRREVIFEVPENFSIAKTEAVLCAYFTDLGYKPLIENMKDSGVSKSGAEVSKITITIT